MNRFTPLAFDYDRDYFFESYRKQYGKTYLDDFPNLIAIAKQRLAVIKKLKPVLQKYESQSSLYESPFPSLLDIGCAYGPFLAAAREQGFFPFGIDPAEEAIHYVTQTLGINAVRGFFPVSQSLFPVPCFDVITLWYVIEHFEDCVSSLVEIKKLLKPGGILAFSTPSFSGISGCGSLHRFLENSPADHWTIWSPSVCKKALKKTGFKVKKVLNTGHHPQRFPLLGKFAAAPKSPLYRVLLAVSKLFRLGDTFEVYGILVNKN